MGQARALGLLDALEMASEASDLQAWMISGRLSKKRSPYRRS
jgi:hypothetical protein